MPFAAAPPPDNTVVDILQFLGHPGLYSRRHVRQIREIARRWVANNRGIDPKLESILEKEGSE